jgi:hypothetical protein
MTDPRASALPQPILSRLWIIMKGSHCGCATPRF